MDNRDAQSELIRERKKREELESRLAQTEAVLNELDHSGRAETVRKLASGVQKDRVSLQRINIWPPNTAP